ncbi:ferric-chelate reductase [Fusarium heterosporum]|uniref:Ferric-chelate reductase n=1 Tax=Fusarium heterosporum TaxID=42747 RepID=A0A8H5T7Z7_FUSHE|nr:ferric-chelate reductase [Fusarium heterosporum]
MATESLKAMARGGWAYFWRICHMKYWWMGELATIFMCLLICLSIFWLRRQQYELFLVVHIVLSVLILLTMLGHISVFRGDYDPLVWVPAIIWLLDRTLRGVRIIAFNPKVWNSKALVTYNKDAEMIRINIPLSSNVYNISPGTFYYVMVLNKWNFWESHPFTVASVSGHPQYVNGPSTESSPLLRHMPLACERIASSSEENKQKMTFLIRPYTSFTLRLKEYAETECPKPATLPVAVEGPYGKSLPLEGFDEILFLVGGSGIAVPLSYLGKLIKLSSQTRSITIHWAVRQTALAIDILNQELSEVLHDRRVKIVIYLTSLDDRKSHGEAVLGLVELRSKRMNVEDVINEACETKNEGSMAVVTSGPGKMADEKYFEESFQW